MYFDPLACNSDIKLYTVGPSFKVSSFVRMFVFHVGEAFLYKLLHMIYEETQKRKCKQDKLEAKWKEKVEDEERELSYNVIFKS